MTMFRNRTEAGVALGKALSAMDLTDPVVLGIPRGGVIVAFQVAKATGGRLDVIVPLKLRAPGQPELGLGAIVAGGDAYIDQGSVGSLGIDSEYLKNEIEDREAESLRRSLLYREGRSQAEVASSEVVLVDDGVATGGTAVCALRSIRRNRPKSVTLAIPVAPRDAVKRLEREADRVVCLQTPLMFVAVGRWYEEFDQVNDEQVMAALKEVA